MTTLNQLTTSRLILRLLSGDDAKDLLTMQSDPNVGRFIGDISNPAPEHAIALFGIAKADAQLIGLVGIFTSLALDGQEVELGVHAQTGIPRSKACIGSVPQDH